MPKINIPTLLTALLLAKISAAEVPSVAVDIPPVQALVAQVLGDLGSPALIIQPGASPHSYALRPSEARALQKADLVIWTSAALTPWLEKPLATLGRSARTVELLEAQGTYRLPLRQSASFAPHDHEDEAEHGHAWDPHAWLDPENGKVWLGVIATALSDMDPANAATYAMNARAGKAEIDRLSADIRAILAPFQGTRFIVFHDAYQYFETRFSLLAEGAISLSDASDPGPARLAEVRDLVKKRQIACVFGEPQFNASLVRTVLQDTLARSVVIDPMGVDLPPGPGLYGDLLRQMAENMAGCVE